MRLSTKILLVSSFLFTTTFASAQNRYDIVIDEIMADPTPQIGLPNSEWIELRNTTGATINLLGWRIGNASGTSGAMPSFNLLPDSCVVICTASAVAGLAVFGNTIKVTSFPSLDNNGEQIFLRSPTAKIIHAVEYSINWYKNTVKANGGWTLEMIDTKNPCSGASNWAASINPKGGTPGKKNSVDGINKDITAPRLLRAFCNDATTATLIFDEPLDSLKAATTLNYSISNNIGTPISAVCNDPLLNTVDIKIAGTFSPNTIYTVTASNLTDCAGTQINSFNQCKVGLATLADSMDIVINEILFNPNTFGVDYVELYNQSNKIIDLKTLILANRNSSTNTIGSLQALNTNHYNVYPTDFMVATHDAAIVKSQYTAKNQDAFTQIPMPSYPNDNGYVVLLNNAGKIIDELDYSQKWHFALVDNDKGVALERIDYSKPTNDPNNWTSAASSVGFGTPTYQNSQFRANVQAQGQITVLPKVFSPDNDGIDDFALINFTFPEAGYVANITIYDASGRAIRILQKNATCAATGIFKWDGLSNKQLKVPVGPYIIYTEIFNLKGQVKSFKNTVVVARRF